MAIDVIVESGDWDEAAFETLATHAVMSSLHHLSIAPDLCEMSIMGCDDARIAALNADFRGKPNATNVLSWPALDLRPDLHGQEPRRPAPDVLGVIELGDIAIAREICLREAADLGKPVADHLTHLIVHGTLHLLGYDHIADADSTLMQKIEAEILGKLGLDDPYR